MLSHRHGPSECTVAFAAWRGFDSRLRHEAATASCVQDGAGGAHHVWWEVEATSADAALALLPQYVAERTEVNRVSEVSIP